MAGLWTSPNRPEVTQEATSSRVVPRNVRAFTASLRFSHDPNSLNNLNPKALRVELTRLLQSKGGNQRRSSHQRMVFLVSHPHAIRSKRFLDPLIWWKVAKGIADEETLP